MRLLAKSMLLPLFCTMPAFTAFAGNDSEIPDLDSTPDIDLATNPDSDTTPGDNSVAVSEKFEVDGLQYEVTAEPDENGAGGEVQLYYAYDFTGDDCEIPAYVTFDGITYTVTAIGYGAFILNECTKIVVPSTVQVIADHAFYEYDDILQELVLGSSVSSVGTGAFTQCVELTDVIFLSAEPPAIADLAANGTYTDNMTIHVHKSAVEAYKDIISDFKKCELFELTFDNSAPTLDVSDDPNTYTVSSSWVSAEPDSYTFSHNANSSLIWSSSNTDVATVSSDGVITAVAKGECTITAKSVFGEEFTLTLTVTDRNENFTGVSNISSDDAPFRAYTISGIEVVTRPLAHGLYIIVYEDGRVEEKGF